MKALMIALLLVAWTGADAAEGQPPRLIEIEAPGLNDFAYAAQAGGLLAAWAGLRDRDVEVRVRFDAPRFELRLIGRDGGTKLRRNAPVSSDEIFALIDAMPMRQAELEARRRADDGDPSQTRR